MRLRDGDFYIVHTTYNWQKYRYKNFRTAYKQFKLACKGDGSAALWRGPNWQRLYTHGYYPEALSKPYI